MNTHIVSSVFAGFGLAEQAAARISAQSAATVYTMTPERIAASTAVLAGLISAVIGGPALARSVGWIGNGNGRRGAIVALILGPMGLVIGALIVVTADGGVGTGNGLAGGVVAVVVGLIGRRTRWAGSGALPRGLLSRRSRTKEHCQ